MGFSVSGSLVLVLLGLFVAAGAVATTGANTMERLAEAQGDRADRVRHVQDAAVDVTAVDLLAGVDCGVEVRANNTGSTTLSLTDTSLVFDDAVLTGWRDGAAVEGNASTSLWAPGEQLVATLDALSTAPDGVTLVTKRGVADRRETEGLAC